MHFYFLSANCYAFVQNILRHSFALSHTYIQNIGADLIDPFVLDAVSNLPSSYTLSILRIMRSVPPQWHFNSGLKSSVEIYVDFNWFGNGTHSHGTVTHSNGTAPARAVRAPAPARSPLHLVLTFDAARRRLRRRRLVSALDQPQHLWCAIPRAPASHCRSAPTHPPRPACLQSNAPARP